MVLQASLMQCEDLSESTFCVPITDLHSPIAYAIVSETHWSNPVRYKGVKTTHSSFLGKSQIKHFKGHTIIFSNFVSVLGWKS